MDPGSAKWTVFWSEKVNGGELGAPDSQSMGSCQVVTCSGFVEGAWMENIRWAPDW